MADSNNPHFPYLPHTDRDRQAMLEAIGVGSFDELVAHIPPEIRAKELELPAGMPELELREHISKLAARNKPASEQACFLGGGSYRRFVPAALPAIVSRSEFATAYTPYQPEVSQGSLQAIYEFQTAVCLLTGMDVANASMYDGPTACAEAALMAGRLTGRSKIVLSDSVNPEHKMVIGTYARSCGLTLFTVPTPQAMTELKDLPIDAQTAAFVVQHPNYFGVLEDLERLAEAAHEQGSLLIVLTDPIALGLLEPPGSSGADIVVGDAQPCGNYLSFGGPSAGFMSTRQEFVRQLPGRLAGMTVDERGQRAFTLTLQTREQHIRRAKATSNICTNQALNALSMLVYLTLMGPSGLRELAELSARRAHHLAELLCAAKGVRLVFGQPFFNEFVIETPRPAAQVLAALRDKGILGGLALERFYPHLKNCILVAVTEMNSVEELNRYGAALASLLAKGAKDASLLPAGQHAEIR